MPSVRRSYAAGERQGPPVIGDAFDRALRDALASHEAARRREQGLPPPPTPDDAAAVSEALTARTVDRPRKRSALVRLRLHRRHWPRVHEHAKRAHIRYSTLRNREGDDPRLLVIEADAAAAGALRQAFPDELEVLP